MNQESLTLSKIVAIAI